MEPYIWIPLATVGAALLTLIAIIIIRTLRFKPGEGIEVDADKIEIVEDEVVSRLVALVRCKTVSNEDPTLEDDAEFEKFYAILPSLYPNVYAKCTLTKFEGRGLLYKYEGKSHDAPSVFMAHYDVVPVSEAPGDWIKPPFSAEV